MCICVRRMTVNTMRLRTWGIIPLVNTTRETPNNYCWMGLIHQSYLFRHQTRRVAGIYSDFLKLFSIFYTHHNCTGFENL